MKVKQIVSEHKKGVKAKIYAKKPKPLIGAEAQKKSEEKRKAEQAKKKQTPITQQPPSKQPANLSEDPNMQAGQTLGTVSKVDQATGKVTYKTPDGQEQTTDPSQLTPTGSNNQLGMKVAGATPGQQIVAVKEEPTGAIAKVNTTANPPVVMDNATGGSPLGITYDGAEVDKSRIALSAPDWTPKQIQANGKTYTALYSGTKGYRVGKKSYEEITGRTSSFTSPMRQSMSATSAQKTGMRESVELDAIRKLSGL
jgi:hypothetical protein